MTHFHQINPINDIFDQSYANKPDSVTSTSSSKARFNSTKILGAPPGNHSYFIHSHGVSKENLNFVQIRLGFIGRER